MRAGRPLEKTRCPPDATPPCRPYVPRNPPEEARMSTIEEPVAVDGAKLEQFVFRAVEEVGATLNAALVVMGDKLGLYRAMAGAGGLTPVDLARRTGVSERYVREWLNAQAAGGFVEYDPDRGAYSLPPEQTVALTDDQSPAYLPGFFQIALGSVIDSPRVTESARSGEGVGWHEHNHDVFDGCERFFRPGYNANLVSAWIPALDGVAEKLEAGGKGADVGCGHGSSTILMAEAYPNSTFVGSDYHAGSIETARRRAEGAGGPGSRGGRARPPPPARRGGRCRGPGSLRRDRRVDASRRGLRPRHDVRLPPRHGRPGRRCAPGAQDSQARRHVADRRADGR